MFNGVEISTTFSKRHHYRAGTLNKVTCALVTIITMLFLANFSNFFKILHQIEDAMRRVIAEENHTGMVGTASKETF